MTLEKNIASQKLWLLISSVIALIVVPNFTYIFWWSMQITRGS